MQVVHLNSDQIADLNLVAAFLAYNQVTDLSSCHDIDAIVICASEVLSQAESLFQTLTANPNLTKTVVLCGGIGHSTTRVYDAVARHPKFQTSSNDISDLAEARVLEKLLTNHYDATALTSSTCIVLVEDQSTNCGLNAGYSKGILDQIGLTRPRRVVVIQDPTMARRTAASFEKAYEVLDPPPEILSCPLFVPRLEIRGSQAVFAVSEIPSSQLWDVSRFLDLIMGEVPRLRDDEAGYGPKGKGFIPHVDVPEDVEGAWMRLESALDARR